MTRFSTLERPFELKVTPVFWKMNFKMKVLERPFEIWLSEDPKDILFLIEFLCSYLQNRYK